MEKAFVKYKIINMIYCFSEAAIYALVDHMGMKYTSMHANTKVFPQTTIFLSNCNKIPTPKICCVPYRVTNVKS